MLIVGGGPAGSTIGALLAADGYSVTLFEKDRHPRFHIGESLLPLNMPLLEKLGLKEEIARIGMPKYGVEFISPWHGKCVEYEFKDSWHKGNPSAFQVRRSVFDHVLLKNAAAKGTTVVEGSRVTEVTFPPEGGVVATGEDESDAKLRWRAKFLVDASGRDTLLAKQFGIKRANPHHNTAAIFGHFTNARRLQGQAEGHISIFWFDYGWFWFIPLSDGTTSVGAVCRPDYIQSRKTDVTQFLRDTIALCPALTARLTDAQLTGPATATGNYSYKADRMAGRNYIMVGDAFAFIDPLFSTGVYLAMTSAFEGAATIKTCLANPAAAPAALARFDTQMRKGVDTFSWYIYRVMRPAFRDMFMAPSNVFRIQESMMSLLSGDVFRPSPHHARLLMFKAIFYTMTFGYRLRDWQAHLFRRPAMDTA